METVHIENLTDKFFVPPKGTYKVNLQIQGRFDCETNLMFNINGTSAKSGSRYFIALYGQVDTSITYEWYEEQFTLDLETTTIECLQPEGKVELTWYH